jgi:hypothetical protein
MISRLEKKLSTPLPFCPSQTLNGTILGLNQGLLSERLDINMWTVENNLFVGLSPFILSLWQNPAWIL